VLSLVPQIVLFGAFPRAKNRALDRAFWCSPSCQKSCSRSCSLLQLLGYCQIISYWIRYDQITVSIPVTCSNGSWCRVSAATEGRHLEWSARGSVTKDFDQGPLACRASHVAARTLQWPDIICPDVIRPMNRKNCDPGMLVSITSSFIWF